MHLNAEGLAPRPIEQLTGSSIVRYYALAWQAMGQALESNLSNGVGDAFTGFAKERLVRRVAEQAQAGLHVRIVDHGHQVKALFYSTDGTAMQLTDRAELEIQTFDGNKLIATDNSAHTYMILDDAGRGSLVRARSRGSAGSETLSSTAAANQPSPRLPILISAENR